MTATPTPIRECDQALDYLYSMLEGDDKARFEQHLATCARCQAELASFGSVRKVAQEALATVEPSERLTGALHQQLLHAAAQRKPRGRVIPFLRRVVSHPGYAAAAAFLLVGGAVGVQWTRGRLLMPTPAAESAPAAPAPAATPPVEAKPETAKADEVKAEGKQGGAPNDGEGLTAPSGNVVLAEKNKEKSLPVVMADPAKHAAAFKGKKEDAASLDRDAWDKAQPGRAARDDAEPRATAAQLKKTRGGDSLDGSLAGLGEGRARGRCAVDFVEVRRRQRRRRWRLSLVADAGEAGARTGDAPSASAGGRADATAGRAGDQGARTEGDEREQRAAGRRAREHRAPASFRAGRRRSGGGAARAAGAEHRARLREQRSE